MALWPAAIVAQQLTPLNDLRPQEIDRLLSPAPNLPTAETPGLAEPVFGQERPLDFRPTFESGFPERLPVSSEIQSNNQTDNFPPAYRGSLGTTQQTTYLQPIDEKKERQATTVEATEPSADDPENRLIFIENSINAEIESTKSDTQLDETTRSNRLSVLTNGAEWIQKAKSYGRKREQFQAGIDGFNEALKTAQEQLKNLDALNPGKVVNLDRPSEELQREMQEVQGELESEKSGLESLHQAQHRFTERITEVPQQKSEAQKRLKKIQDRIAEMTPLEADSHDEAKLLQFAMQFGTAAEIDMLNVESTYLELSSQLSPLRIDLANQKTKQLETQFQQLKQGEKQSREREVEKQILLARQAAIEAHPQLAELANRNAALAQQRMDIAKLKVEVSDEKSSVTDMTLKVEDDLTGLQKKIDECVTSTRTLVLAESHRQLASPLESRVRLGQLKTELRAVNSAVGQLQEERETLADPQALMVDQLKMDPDMIGDNLRSMAIEFIEARRVLLDDLLNDYRSYRRQIVETTVERDKLISGIQATRELLNEHMLWVRSADPVSLQTAKTSHDGIQDLLSAERWSKLLERLAFRARQQPYEYFMFTLGFAFLYGVVRRLKG